MGPLPALSRARLAAAAAAAPTSRSAASAPAPAPPRSIARAESAPRRRRTPKVHCRRAGRRQRRRQRHSSIAVRGSGRRLRARRRVRRTRLARSFPARANARDKGRSRENTTLVVVATDAILTKAEAKRLAVMAQTGFSRAIYPVHTPLDGDVFLPPRPAASRSPKYTISLTTLGAIAANVVARAIALGVFAANSVAFAQCITRVGKTNLAVKSKAMDPARGRGQRVVETTFPQLSTGLKRTSR